MFPHSFNLWIVWVQPTTTEEGVVSFLQSNTKMGRNYLLMRDCFLDTKTCAQNSPTLDQEDAQFPNLMDSSIHIKRNLPMKHESMSILKNQILEYRAEVFTTPRVSKRKGLKMFKSLEFVVSGGLVSRVSNLKTTFFLQPLGTITDEANKCQLACTLLGKQLALQVVGPPLCHVPGKWGALRCTCA